MKYAGVILNAIFIAFVGYGGYEATSPERLGGNNPEWILVPIVVVLTPLAVIGLVADAIYGAQCERLRPASWRRFSLSWRRDPLQVVNLCIVAGTAACFGAGLHLSSRDAVGVWMFAIYVAMLIGLILGRLISYTVFRSRIEKA